MILCDIMKCCKSPVFTSKTLVVWSILVPGNAPILGTQGDTQRPLSWGHGKHPNHNTAPEGVGLTRNLGKFSLSGLLSFLQRGLWSDFIPVRTTDTQRKHKIHINKVLTFIFILSANNYITFAAKFVQTKLSRKNSEFCAHQTFHLNCANRDYQNAGSLLCVRLISIPVTLRWWEG